MTKQIIVNKCSECPYAELRPRANNDVIDIVCSLLNNIISPDGILDDCPLEDEI